MFKFSYNVGRGNLIAMLVGQENGVPHCSATTGWLDSRSKGTVRPAITAWDLQLFKQKAPRNSFPKVCQGAHNVNPVLNYFAARAD